MVSGMRNANIGLAKSLKPLITYFDIDANNYRTASGSYWVKRGNDNE